MLLLSTVHKVNVYLCFSGLRVVGTQTPFLHADESQRPLSKKVLRAEAARIMNEKYGTYHRCLIKWQFYKYHHFVHTLHPGKSHELLFLVPDQKLDIFWIYIMYECMI